MRIKKRKYENYFAGTITAKRGNMEILDQLGTKVQKAVNKIKELKAQIRELKETNQRNEQKLLRYEQKIKNLIQTMDSVNLSE